MLVCCARAALALHACGQHLSEQLLRDRQQWQCHRPLRVCDGCLDGRRRDGIKELHANHTFVSNAIQ